MIQLEERPSTTTTRAMTVKQGEIWLANLGDPYGCEQGGKRLVLIVQNNIGNRYSPATIVFPITSAEKKPLPTHIKLNAQEYGLKYNSTILTEQVKCIDKGRLIEKITELDTRTMDMVEKCIQINFFRSK